MARAFKEQNGTVLSNVVQTLLTFSSGLITGGAVVQALSLVNTGATERTVTVYLIPSGQAAADQYIIGKVRVPVSPDGTVPLPGGPWYGGSGSFVQAKQDAGADVVARLTAFEES